MAKFEGFDSNWNEAMFKMARIHDSQNLINYYKRNPLAITEGKFNFEQLFIEISILYDEGAASYNQKEIDAVDEVKNEIKKMFNEDKPYAEVIENKMGMPTKKFYVYKDKYEKTILLIEKFERLVRFYNNKHGLSTSNKDSGGFFR